MLVKHRLRINAAVSVVSVLAILVVLILTIYRADRSIEASNVADAIITATLERVTLRTDYLRTGNERSKIQVIAKHREIGGLLRAASVMLTDPEDKKIIAELIKNHESIGKIFRTILENRGKRGSPTYPDALSNEIEDRLLSQLNMRVYETVLLGGKLQRSGNEAVISSLKLAGGGILFVLLLVSAAILINSWTMGRAIADRAARLRESAAVIGGGDLEHRIDVKGDDEFAEIGKAFNAMTDKLRGTYNELEHEVRERKRAEEALRKANDELESRIEVRTRELEIANDSVRSERQRLYGVLETLPVYVILLSRDYHVPFANRFFRERFGESDGRRCYEYLFNRTEPCEICETYSVLKTNAPHHWYWTGPDGRNYDIYDYPFVDSDGTALILEMGIDITAWKEAETALTELNDTLEERIIERTAQLNSVNETLRASRIAALNLMEDAVNARKETEEMNDRLLLVIAERKRVEEELRDINEELTRFNSAAVGRELRMIELKKEVNELCGSAGELPRYPLEFEGEQQP